MTKFKVQGRLDFVNLFESRRTVMKSRDSEEVASPNFGIAISDISNFETIDDIEFPEKVMAHHEREFSNIHGQQVDGISATSRIRPPVIGLNAQVIAMCKIWNCSPDRFLFGKRAEVILSEFHISSPYGRRKMLVVIAVRILDEVRLPTEDELWAIMGSEDATAAFSKWLRGE